MATKRKPELSPDRNANGTLKDASFPKVSPAATTEPTPITPVIPEGAGTGNAYIREREKLASQAGISSKAAAARLVDVTQAYNESEAKEAAIAAAATENAKVPTVPSSIDLEQQTNPLEAAGALGAGAAGALGGAAIGTKLGALAAPFTAGASIPIGAVAGAIAGFASAYLGKLSIDERQNVKELRASFDGIKTSFSSITGRVKLDPTYKDQSLSDWATQKANIYKLERVLKQKTSNNLKEFLGDPGDELADVEAYVS